MHIGQKVDAQGDDGTPRAVARLGVTAESRLLRAGDLRLHAVVAGPEAGPLAVLLHGFPECWHSWARQIPALAAAGFRVVAPDQRGYNLSDKPRGISQYRIDLLTADVLHVIRALGREQAIVIGHDWGGAVAWRLAMDQPQAVERLIIMNAPHPVALAKALRRGWSQRLKSWYMLFFQMPWLPETLLRLSPAFTGRLFFRRLAVRAGAFSDDDLEVMAAALARPGAMRAMIHWYRAAFRFPPVQRARVIDLPSLLIWAEDDIALGLSLTHGLERWVPNLRTHYIAHCGHWVQNEASEEVNEQVLAFLSE
jgi:epoxide hydrolase 4